MDKGTGLVEGEWFEGVVNAYALVAKANMKNPAANSNGFRRSSSHPTRPRCASIPKRFGISPAIWKSVINSLANRMATAGSGCASPSSRWTTPGCVSSAWVLVWRSSNRTTCATQGSKPPAQ